MVLFTLYKLLYFVLIESGLIQACDIIGDDAQIVRVVGADRGSDIQKLGPLFKVFEHVLGMIDNRIDWAADKIDSSVSEVKDSIRQLREAIERMDERNSITIAGAARNLEDKCAKVCQISLSLKFVIRSNAFTCERAYINSSCFSTPT